MLKRIKVQIPQELHQTRLDQAMAKLLPEYSRSWIRKMIVQGAVYLNQKRIRVASRMVQAKSYVEIMVREEATPRREIESIWKDWELTSQNILFEDDSLIVVDKPAGLPTQPTLDEARAHLVDKVQRYLRKSNPNAYVGIHHRLDRDTSGVILFTKDRAVNAAIAKQFQVHEIQKTYEAIAGSVSPRKMPDQWRVENFLGPVSKKGKAKRMGEVQSGGLKAITEFRRLDQRPLGELPKWLWIEAKPLTGRMHQIRVHAAEKGWPLVGDHLYGGLMEGAPRLLLHARKLTFRHPKAKELDEKITVECPVSQDFTQFWERCV